MGKRKNRKKQPIQNVGKQMQQLNIESLLKNLNYKFDKLNIYLSKDYNSTDPTIISLKDGNTE